MRFTRFLIQEWHCFRHAEGDLSRVKVASVIGRLSTAPEKSNGAGKSYFIESVKYVFFGSDREPSSIQRLKAKEDTFVEWYFEHRGKKARIKRGFKIKRDGTKGAGILEFEIDGESQGEKMVALQAAIEEFVGCDEGVYSSTSFFTQGDADQFVRTTPAERKRILSNLLGLSQYEAARIRADRDLAVLTESIDSEDRRAGLARLSLEEARKRVEELRALDLQGSLDRQDAVIASLVALQGDYPESLSGVRSFRDALEPLETAVVSARAVRNTCDSAYNTATTAVERVTKRKTDRHRVLADEYRVRQERIRAVPVLEAEAKKAAHDLRAAEAEAAALVVEDPAPWRAAERAASAAIGESDAEMKAAEAALKKIDTLGATCPTCQQPVSDAHKEGHRAEWRAKHDAAGKRRAEAVRARDDAKAQQDRIEGLGRQRQAVALRIASLKPTVVSRDAALAEANRAAADRTAAIEAAKIEMEALEAEIALAESERATAHVTARDAKAALSRAEEALSEACQDIDEDAEPAVARLYSRIVARYKEAGAERDRILDQIRSLKHAESKFDEGQRVLIEVETNTRGVRVRMEDLRVLSKAFSKNGIPHLVAENVVAEIEKGTVEILQALESPNRVIFRTMTEQGADTIQIEVETPDGVRGLKSFSGGQVTEQNLAIRLALGEVLARRAEVAFESVFLDEVMAPLDAPARQCFLRVVNLMRRSFSQIFVISHFSEIRDVLESSIAVEWHPDGATVEVSE